MAVQSGKSASSFGPFVQFAFVGLAALGVYSFVSASREGELRRRCATTCILRPTYASASRKAPDFSLSDMQGKTVKLSDFAGKTIVLNFWTKTCGPCLEEMPEIADLARITKPMGDVVVLTVSTDEGPESVRDTLMAVLREPPPFPVLFDPDAKVVSERYGTRLFPETWIIDGRGVIRARFDGGKEWSNSSIVQYLQEIRRGGYCPLDIEDGKMHGEGVSVCEAMGT